MSSTFPKATSKGEVIVIGSRFAAGILGHALLNEGCVPRVFIVDDPTGTEPADIPLHVGNGECFENVRLTFGDSVAKSLWEISNESFRKARALSTRLQVPLTEGKLLWFASTERERLLLEASARSNPFAASLKGPEWLREGNKRFEAVYSEPAASLAATQLSGAIQSKFIEREAPFTVVESLEGVEKHHGLEYRFRFRTGGKESSAVGSLGIIATDRVSPSLFPSVKDKWLPVTLGSFSFKAKTHKEFIVALFNGGADFAFRSAGMLRLGSFRNLYQDKALGVHDAPDPATLHGVAEYFSALDWIVSESPTRGHVTVQSLSCDGLPLVGPLADFPGIHLLAGFSGREQNFIFDIAEQMAKSLIREASADRLKYFSTKRFL